MPVRCDTFGRKPLLVGFPLVVSALRLLVAFRPCWPTLFAAELANYMMYQVAPSATAGRRLCSQCGNGAFGTRCRDSPAALGTGVLLIASPRR